MSEDDGTSRLGGVFKRLGAELADWGLPFSKSLERIEKDLEQREDDE